MLVLILSALKFALGSEISSGLVLYLLCVLTLFVVTSPFLTFFYVTGVKRFFTKQC
jgi:hypothetical protein